MYLRPITIYDFDLVLEWAQNPELDEYFRRTPPLCDWATPEKFLAQMGDQYIVVKEGAAVGLLSMGIDDPQSRTVKWGVLLAKKDAGDSTRVNNLVKQIAFDKLGCNRLICIILSHREGIKKNLLAAGYQYEGTFRNSCWYRGKLHNEDQYGLLRE